MVKIMEKPIFLDDLGGKHYFWKHQFFRVSGFFFKGSLKQTQHDFLGVNNPIHMI